MVFNQKLLVLCAAVLCSIVVPLVSAEYFPSDLLEDDAAITLRYVDNLSAGRGYRYNASDTDPIFGASSFLFTTLAALLKKLSIFENDFLYMKLPGLIGYGIVLFMFFWSGYIVGGLLPGVLSFLYAASFAGYFYYASSGLESLMAAALLCSVFHVYYFKKSPSWLMVLCLGMVLTKMDLLVIAVLLVTAQTCRDWKHGDESPRKCIMRLLVLFVGPSALFFLFCWMYFGSPFPNSMVAKLLVNPSRDGLLYFRYLFSIHRSGVGLLPTGYMLLISLIPLSVLLVTAFVKRALPRFEFLVLLTGTIILLVQVSVVPFGELFLWYFVVPMMGVQLLVVLSLNEWRLLVASDRSLVVALPLMPTLALVLCTVVIPLLPGARPFNQSVSIFRSILLTIERERRTLGEFLGKTFDPSQVLLAGHGWPAYESKMTVIDLSGINSPQVIPYRGPAMFSKIVSSFHPDAIMIHSIQHPRLVLEYELLHLGFNIYDYTGGAWREWVIYKRRSQPRAYTHVSFPHLDRWTRSPAKGLARTIFRRTPSDYLLRAGPPPGSETFLECRDLPLDNSTVGAYCYVDNLESSPADFKISVLLPTGDRLSSSLTLGPRDGIRLLTLDIPGKPEGAVLRIGTQLHGSANSGFSEAHVRDVFAAK